MADYIPAQDADFNNWVTNFSTYVAGNFASLGLTATQNTDLQAATSAWSSNYPAHLAAQTTAESVRQVKETSRDNLEAVVRELANLIQANSLVTNEQKAALGLTIRKETRTPSPVPTTRPMADINNKNRLQHVISFFDESTPNSKAKPFGVSGCMIYHKIGDPAPTDESQVTFVATDTKTPYLATFDGADGGKTVHYWLRWVNTRGEFGPWSETISVTVSA